jgi:hypothetical protein
MPAETGGVSSLPFLTMNTFSPVPSATLPLGFEHQRLVAAVLYRLQLRDHELT